MVMTICMLVNGNLDDVNSNLDARNIAVFKGIWLFWFIGCNSAVCPIKCLVFVTNYLSSNNLFYTFMETAVKFLIQIALHHNLLHYTQQHLNILHYITLHLSALHHKTSTQLHTALHHTAPHKTT